MKRLKNGAYKVCGVTLIAAPTDKFPEMVVVDKAVARMKSLYGKKFVNLTFAQKTIEAVATETLIESASNLVAKELEEIVIIDEADVATDL